MAKRPSSVQTDRKRGSTTRLNKGRRTTRRRAAWLPDEEPEETASAAPEATPAPAVVIKAPTAAPTPAPVIELPAPATPPTWGATEWVTVRYDGPTWFIHPSAGVFVPGTTTRLRGDLARDLPSTGFQFQAAARRAG